MRHRRQGRGRSKAEDARDANVDGVRRQKKQEEQRERMHDRRQESRQEEKLTKQQRGWKRSMTVKKEGGERGREEKKKRGGKGTQRKKRRNSEWRPVLKWNWPRVHIVPMPFKLLQIVNAESSFPFQGFIYLSMYDSRTQSKHSSDMVKLHRVNGWLAWKG